MLESQLNESEHESHHAEFVEYCQLIFFPFVLLSIFLGGNGFKE